jgi:hypothetical protein
VITAKPLKRKHLGSLTGPDAPTTPASELVQSSIKPSPNLDGTKSPIKRVLSGKDIKKLVKAIVNDCYGVSGSEVNYLLLEFLKRKDYQTRTSYGYSGNVYSLLKMLVDDDEITRIEVKGKFYYFPIRM